MWEIEQMAGRSSLIRESGLDSQAAENGWAVWWELEDNHWEGRCLRTAGMGMMSFDWNQHCN